MTQTVSHRIEINCRLSPVNSISNITIVYAAFTVTTSRAPIKRAQHLLETHSSVLSSCTSFNELPRLPRAYAPVTQLVYHSHLPCNLGLVGSAPYSLAKVGPC